MFVIFRHLILILYIYTSLPHNTIKEILGNIINDAFNYVDKEYIRVTFTKAYFSDSNTINSKHDIFDRNQVIKLLELSSY